MLELSINVATRGRLKGSITRALKYASEVSTEVTGDQLSNRIENLKETWQQFTQAIHDSYAFANDEGFADPEGDFVLYETKYLEALDLLTLARSARAVTSPTADGNSLAAIAQQQTEILQSFAATAAPQQELPKINIPCFAGQYQDWPSFRDLFLSSVDRRRGLTDTQRFHYLKTFLKGDAANLIKHIAVTEANYNTAWARLRDRFERPRHIVNSFVRTFMGLPSCNGENIASLRSIADGASEVMRGLDAMKESSRDCWVIHLLLEKVDPETRRKWAEATTEDSSPTVYEFLAFLDSRCEQMELTQVPRKSGRTPASTTRAMVSIEERVKQCPKCKDQCHELGRCAQFAALPADQRQVFIRENTLCFNCLKPGHRSRKCNSRFRCKVCKQRHHSLLHRAPDISNQHRECNEGSESWSQSPNDTSRAADATSSQESLSRRSAPTVSHVARNPDVVVEAFVSHPLTRRALLPVAMVDVQNAQGRYITCRMLLDSGSELSYISERCAQTLGLPREKSQIVVTGISSVKADTTRGSCSVHIKSRLSDFCLDACVHVLHKITSTLPGFEVSNEEMQYFANLQLADPLFFKPAQIDILLGAEHMWGVITCHKMYDVQKNPIAISTQFGWVVTSVDMKGEPHHLTLLATPSIDNALRSFWEIEEAHVKIAPRSEDAAVEQHFIESHTRDPDGNYRVFLPFKTDTPQFSNTIDGALSRFKAVERRLMRDQKLREQYISFMEEYIRLGHMQRLSPSEILTTPGRTFYLPHHPVLGQKLRVVFDGSFKDRSGVSLNDQLCIGPTIQRELFAVCLRFRLPRFVFTADIVKMFRQVRVAEHQQDFQRILWRKDPANEIQHYKLCTVTYGTSCAPFLAVRVLNQLALDHAEANPTASSIILRDFYVDDVLTGASSPDDLINKRDELISMLSLAGFKLDKWASNHPSFENTRGESTYELAGAARSEAKKVLGLHWCPNTDTLRYRLSILERPVPTKRQVLSDVSRIFDPLGLLAPVIINFKVIFQELWLLNLRWDDPLPPDLEEAWLRYRHDLRLVDQVSVPRFTFSDQSEIELHGFSDASIKAYAAVVYCRAKTSDGTCVITLMTAKTRVAPLKQISLPRLELCGALLLTRLITSVKEALSHINVNVTAWCDSTVVLAWLSRPPIQLKTFVANRTSEILETLPRSCWHHVTSKDNPADCASRGMRTEVLLTHRLWWNGPNWLRDEFELTKRLNSNLPFSSIADPAVTVDMKEPSSRMLAAIIIPSSTNPLVHLLDRVSSWSRLLRVVSYILRFCSRIRRRLCSLGRPTASELMDAKRICLRLAQDCFGKERAALKTYQQLPRTSSLLKLTPFLDDHGLLRVGGRIKRSSLVEAARHPIILPKGHRVTTLILQEEHVRHFHPGVNALFFIIRQTYWIVGARNLIRALTHKCVVCFRHRRHLTQQLMADLPTIRIRQALPFENSGCDYAGPFTLRLYRGRNSKTTKGYICLFVCLVTSAVHLELASDLSTDAFLAALRRFMSRRGKCAQIYSDNGRNFVGAARVITDMHNLLRSEAHCQMVSAALAAEGIRWTFVPPHAPHWGGIWESAIRSVKLHLRRVVGRTVLTVEQMTTLLTQIEAVVNSRPLGSTSDLAIDFLTPSHFLLGRATTMLPEPDASSHYIPLHDYWRAIQAMFQGFWKQWHSEYLTSLQQRPKWLRQQRNVEVGDVVIIKDIATPPATWIMGRVVEAYPGQDGLVRSVKLRTATGELTRPITKVAVLPNSETLFQGGQDD